MTEPTPTTLTQARAEFFDRVNDGATCPCCDRFGKRYVRKLNSSMAVFLVNLVKEWWKTGKKAVHHSDVEYSGRDYSYLTMWGLIEAPEALGRGYWLPTRDGIEFATGERRVFSHAEIWNNECSGFTGELTTIDTALGNHFDFEELLGATKVEILRAKANEPGQGSLFGNW